MQHVTNRPKPAATRNELIGRKLRCACCGAAFAPGAEADSRDPAHPRFCRGCAGHLFQTLDLSNVNNFVVIVAVLNTLEQIGHHSGGRTTRDMARAAAAELRAIVPPEVLDAPGLRQIRPEFDVDDKSICELVMLEFPLDKQHPLVGRYQPVNEMGFSIEDVCESIPGTKKTEGLEWVSDQTGDVPRITYHFTDSSALHVYPTLRHWVPS